MSGDGRAGVSAVTPGGGATRAGGSGAPWLLLAACALPHALRALWPLVEFGGGDTLLAARRLAAGDAGASAGADGPGLLEHALGPLLSWVGGSPRAFELLTIALVLVTAWLLRAAGRRLAGSWAGAAAALAWSAHPWVLQRQLFDRGLWAAPVVAWLVLWACDEGGPRARRLVAPALALFAVLALDAPFAWPVVGMTGWVLCRRRGPGPGLLLTGGVVAVVAALTLAGASAADAASAGAGAGTAADLPTRLASLAAHADPLLLLGLVTALLLVARGRRAALVAPALLLGLELLRAALRLPGDGAAAMIGPALPAALFVGLGLEAALGGETDAARPRQAAPLRNAMVLLTALLMGVVIFDVFGPRDSGDAAPGAARPAPGADRPSVVRAWLTDRWRPPQEGYGLFGGRPRAHLAARVALLREHTSADDAVAGAWAWEAAAADRPRWTPRAADDVRLYLEPLPPGVSADDLAAAGWRRVASDTQPDVAAWLRDDARR